MKLLSLLTTCLLFWKSNIATAFPQVNAPVRACTFYKSIWAHHFLRCAQPQVKAFSCTKSKYVGLTIVRYQGDLVSMYLPDFLIETTVHAGKSLFSAAGPMMQKHLNLASKWQQKKTSFGIGVGGIFDNGGARDKEQSYFWHARLLPVPYGGFNSYPKVKRGAGGNTLPKCFTGISEFYPDQWMTGLSDLPFAMAMAPIGIPMCYSDAGIVSQTAAAHAQAVAKQSAKTAMNSLVPVDVGSFKLQTGCAYPITARAGLAMNLRAGSDAYNLGRLCMGTLGNLLPREGSILSHERFRSSVMAAWKFASLTKDFHPGSTAGISYDDKWQIMVPKSTRAQCFRAGQLSDLIPGPIEIRSPADSLKRKDTYVYAIWRKRTACLEPYSGQGWRAAVLAQHQAFAASCGGL